MTQTNMISFKKTHVNENNSHHRNITHTFDARTINRSQYKLNKYLGVP